VAPTLQYAKVVEQAREEFRDFLWDGTWLGRDAARVATTPDDAGVSAVFEASDGRRLVAFANYELDEVTATVEVPWLGSRGSWRIVGGPGGPLDAPTFRVPARSCLLVVEE
jgi:hypothetical protein